jgi:uncharacterized protein
MLLRFGVANYASFRSLQELSLVASNGLKHDEAAGGVWQAPGPGVPPALTAAGVYGHNASGKTRLLLALQAMASAVANSHRSWPPDGPVPAHVRTVFALDPAMREQPTKFEIDCVVKGLRYSYAFSLDERMVVEERLHSFPEGRRRLLFERHPGGPIRFGRGFFRGKAVERLLRPNSLLLSTAAQNNVEDAVALHAWFSKIRFPSEANEPILMHRATERVRAQGGERLAALLRAADLAILGISTREDELPEHMRSMLRHLLGQNGEIPLEAVPTRSSQLLLLHASTSGDPVEIEVGQESAGTRSMVALAFPVLDALADGSLLLIDELERSLHPLLAREILRLFLTENPKGAQLVFSTHHTPLLEHMRRDAVWFTEKQADGATWLYPLSDFHPRKHASIERAYLEGRYGAVPALDALVTTKAERADGAS